jgi:prenyltransferase beta subunit
LYGRHSFHDQGAFIQEIFLLAAALQDEEDGGISDRPDDMADVYHTFFGIAGLSLMGHAGLAAIDPTYALPVTTVQRLKQQQQQQQQQQQGSKAVEAPA